VRGVRPALISFGTGGNPIWRGFKEMKEPIRQSVIILHGAGWEQNLKRAAPTPAALPGVKVKSNPRPTAVGSKPLSGWAPVKRVAERGEDGALSKRPRKLSREEEEDRLDAELLSKIQAELPLPFVDPMWRRTNIIGVVRVLRLGTFPADYALRENGVSLCAATKSVLAPIGFKSERTYSQREQAKHSALDDRRARGPAVSRKVTCEVAFEKNRIAYIVRDGKKVFKGSTANEAWGLFTGLWNRPNIRNDDKGAPRFGIGMESVQHIMALLPNAQKLRNGPFHRFKKTRKAQREEARRMFELACKARQIERAGGRINPLKFLEENGYAEEIQHL